MQDIRAAGKTKEAVMEEVKEAIRKDHEGIVVFGCETETLREIGKFVGQLGFQIKPIFGGDETAYCFFSYAD